jgi:hypothetical protein
MIELIIFSTLLSTYTLWVVIRTNKKIDLLGQLGALILTQVSRQYTAEDYPEEDLQRAVNDWEDWDKE